jgi:hypothetical protein
MPESKPVKKKCPCMNCLVERWSKYIQVSEEESRKSDLPSAQKLAFAIVNSNTKSLLEELRETLKHQWRNVKVSMN